MRRQRLPRVSGDPLHAVSSDDLDEPMTEKLIPPAPTKTKLRLIGAVMVVLLCGGAFPVVFKIYDFLFPPFKYIDISRDNAAKEVFFGQQPWFVYCQGPNPTKNMMPPSVSEARGEFPNGVRAAVMDCQSRMSSGRSVVQRFNLPISTVAFVVARGRYPVAVPRSILSSSTRLVDFVAKAAQIRVLPTNTLGGFEGACLNRDGACIIFSRWGGLRKNMLETVLPNILSTRPEIRAIAVDSSHVQLKLDKKLRQQKAMCKRIPSDGPTALCMHRTTELGADGQPRNKYTAKLFDGSVEDRWDLHYFLRECANPGTDFITLEELPQFLQRSSRKRVLSSPKSPNTLDASDEVPNDETDSVADLDGVDVTEYDGEI